MRRWTGQLWPIVLVLVVYILPLEFASGQYRVTLVQDETTRIVLIALLVVAALSGIAALIFIALYLASSVLTIGRPATTAGLRRTIKYAAWGAGLGLLPVAIVLGIANPLDALVYAVLVGFYLLYVMPASRRRIGYRSIITVRCTPEAAFALVSDPHNWHRYLPDLQVIEPVETPLRVGTVVTERITERRQVLEGQDEVTLIDPNRKLATQDPSGRATGLYEFIPVEAGTEISYTVEHRLGIAEAVIGGVLRRGAITKMLLSRRESAMKRIKAILEAPPATTV